VQTLVDGGIRLTIDLPENCIAQAAMLMECKRQGIPLDFAASAMKKKDDDMTILESLVE